MATPLSADQKIKALRGEGVDVREYKSWRTHNRDGETGRTFGPVHGIVIHHTAGSDSLSLCYNGTSSLPGPLCHTHLSKTGVATMVGHGRANHAGSFAANAHSAVLAESSVHPRPTSAETIDANDCYYGIEIENLGNGKDPYPVVQYEAAVRWAAAICRSHGWSENSVIGHKEGTTRKIDPSFDMNVFRDAVAARLIHPASWSPGSGPEEDTDPMAGITKSDIYDAVWATDRISAPADAPDIKTNPAWQPQSYLKDTNLRVRRLEAQLAAQNAVTSELVKTVSALAANATAIDPDALVARIRGAIENVTIHLDVPDA